MTSLALQLPFKGYILFICTAAVTFADGAVAVSITMDFVGVFAVV